MPTFGRYRDASLLGQGGMGAVYKCTDPMLDRFVAIKVLTHREPKYVERFRREAQVLAKIMHPSIIQIYEIVGSDDEANLDPYIVMEYFEAKPLDSILKMGPIAGPTLVSILRQTAEGLKKAHANGVIHRDIKPGNIMMAANGDVKILDFGIAKALDAKKDLTGETVLGTPYYMSPEQAMGQPIDARSDLYSLGITAFHLLAGKRPFEAKSKVDVMLMQVKTPLPDLRELVPDLDARIIKIVEKMSAKQPQSRFQNTQELIDACDELPKSLGGRARDETFAEPVVMPAPRPWPAPAASLSPSPATPTPVRATQPHLVTPTHTPRQAPQGKNKSILIGAVSALAALSLVGAAVLAVKLRDSHKAGRVPASGWSYPGAPASQLKKLQAQGGYGNCIFSTKPLEEGQEHAGLLRTVFGPREAIQGRCYFAHEVGPNKTGEVWQEVWVDGTKRAQVTYDRPLPNDMAQLQLDVSAQHASRLAELSPGKHIFSLWIFRQSEDAENPEALAAGELMVRK